MADTITLISKIDGFAFSALHAQPQGARKGGIVVVQEIFGIDQYVVADVERWAALGFEVIAPSMFDRQEFGFTAEHDSAGFEAGRSYAGANGTENPVSDVQACIDAMKDKGPVFLTGYCYGGTIAWRSAAQATDLAAAACYYGGGIAAIADLPLACAVICHFGRKDGHIPADETAATIKAAHPDVPVYIYEKSGHGFNNDGRPDSDPDDQKLARGRTLALFQAKGAT